MISRSYIANRIKGCLGSRNRHHKINRFSRQAALFLLLALTACGPGYVYEKTRPIAETGWTYSDSLTYDFEIADTSTIYDLHLIVDHKDNFPSQNTYIRLKLRFPNGQRTDEQVSLQMADEFGLWLGNCSGEDCSLDIPIQTGAYFSQAGQYQLTVEQFSREENLSGITAITFALAEHNP